MKSSKDIIQAVIFDIDGTLVDSVDLHARAWQDAFARYDKDIDYQGIRNQIGKGGDQILPIYLSDEEIASFGKELTEYRSQIFKADFIEKVVPFAGVRALFERIKADGKKIALGSSANQEELEYYIQLTNVADLVDAKTCADDADNSKPDPDIFAVALDKLIVPAHLGVVVGDSPYDAEAAKRLKVPAIGFLCGGFCPQSLKNASAMALYQGAEELHAQYEQSLLAA